MSFVPPLEELWPVGYSFLHLQSLALSLARRYRRPQTKHSFFESQHSRLECQGSSVFQVSPIACAACLDLVREFSPPHSAPQSSMRFGRECLLCTPSPSLQESSPSLITHRIAAVQTDQRSGELSRAC